MRHSSSFRTLVVVPMLLTTRKAIEQQIEAPRDPLPREPEGELYFAAAFRLGG